MIIVIKKHCRLVEDSTELQDDTKNFSSDTLSNFIKVTGAGYMNFVSFFCSPSQTSHINTLHSPSRY